jgi:hypothetical protein
MKIDMQTPKFKGENIAKAVGIAPQTLRNWINSGNIDLIYSLKAGGPGVRSLFSGLDFVQLLIAAELSHLGLGPKGFHPVLVQLTYNVARKIEEISLRGEAYYDFLQQRGIRNNDKRFYAIYYKIDGNENSFLVKNQEEPGDVIQDAQDVTKIVIDCFELAKKAITLFAASE